MSATEKSKKKILIIEDDESITRIYDIKFSHEENIEIFKAGDGEIGLEKMIKEKPDLVLLDLMLPNKDGFWVLEERKKHAALNEIPVIVLTNLGQGQDKKRALDLGATAYLVKADVPIKQIIDTAKEYLAKS